MTDPEPLPEPYTERDVFDLALTIACRDIHEMILNEGVDPDLVGSVAEHRFDYVYRAREALLRGDPLCEREPNDVLY